MRKGIMYLIFAVFMVFSSQYVDAQAVEADMILINGKVVTVDKDFSIKQAIAVKNGWIVAVGTNADIQKFAGKKTQVMDLKGKAILPGSMSPMGTQPPLLLFDHPLLLMRATRR